MMRIEVVVSNGMEKQSIFIDGKNPSDCFRQIPMRCANIGYSSITNLGNVVFYTVRVCAK